MKQGMTQVVPWAHLLYFVKPKPTLQTIVFAYFDTQDYYLKETNPTVIHTIFWKCMHQKILGVI